MFTSIISHIMFMCTMVCLGYLSLKFCDWLHGKLAKRYPSLKKFSISRLTNRRSKKKEHQITPINVTCHIVKYPFDEKTGEPGKTFCGKFILTTKASVSLTPITKGPHAYSEINIDKHIEPARREHHRWINTIISCEKCEEEYNYFAQRKRFELKID